MRDIVDVGIGAAARTAGSVDSERFRVVRDYVWTIVMQGPDRPDGPRAGRPPLGDLHQAGSRKEQG